jgi:hypothetical protein
MTRREGLSVDFPQRSNMHRPMLVADLPILVAMPMATKDSLFMARASPIEGVSVAPGVIDKRQSAPAFPDRPAESLSAL